MNTGSPKHRSSIVEALSGPWAKQFVIYFGLVSLGFAQPLYNSTLLFRNAFRADFVDFLVLVIACQFGLSALLILFRFVLMQATLRKVFDALVFIGAALTIARQAQLHYLKTEGLEGNEKLLIVFGVLVAVVIITVLLRRFINSAALYIGLVSPLFGVVFLFDVSNHALPLNGGGEAQQPKTDKPAVILLVLDEFSLPAALDETGAIDETRFPNLSRLSKSGIWFKNAITNYPTSSYSFPSFLIGQYKFGYQETMINDMESLPAGNLFDLYAKNGYAVSVYEDVFGCGGRKYHCRSYNSGDRSGFVFRVISKFIQEFGPDFLIDQYLPQLQGLELHHQHDVLLETARNAKPGTFNFIHAMTSHAPYVFDAKGQYKYSSALRLSPGVNFEASRQAMIAQLQYVDIILGKFLDIIDARSKDNPVYAFITSDHGNCWTPNCPGRVYPKLITEILPELTNVPAILIGPDIPPRVDTDDFQLIDLFPTLTDATDLKVPEGLKLDGVSRLKNPPPPRKRAFYLLYDEPSYDLTLPTTPITLKKLDVAQ